MKKEFELSIVYLPLMRKRNNGFIVLIMIGLYHILFIA